MSGIGCRAWIAGAGLVVALATPRPAGAQAISPPPPRQPGGLARDINTGVQYDRLNRAAAERHIVHREGILRHHLASGHVAAADRDARRIENLRYRVVVDDWLIRVNSLQDPGCYPYPLRLDPMSAAAIGQYRRY